MTVISASHDSNGAQAPECSEGQRQPLGKLLRTFLLPNDGRYEDLWLPGTTFPKQLLHDFIAGLIIATIAIPIAMGFAIASGLHPVQGIVGGAVGCGLGALVGGSKYQIYGPTAAFIPVITGILHDFSNGDPEHYFYANGCLAFCSCVAGVIIILLGLLQVGSFAQRVPHSIVVGFTIGIAAVIFLSELADILGLHENVPPSAAGKLVDMVQRFHEYNWYCVFIGVMTFALIKGLGRISVFIPGPIVSIAVGILLTEFVWPDKGIMRVVDQFGPIPSDLLRFTPPMVPHSHYALVVRAVLSIVFVSVIESLLCSRMADKLANNTRQPFNPNKELWGQGWVQIFVPILNGFPNTGALARTATNVKVGAVSPMAGIFMCVLKLMLAFLTTPILNVIPMACVGGILAYVAVNMVKAEEVASVVKTGDSGAVLVMLVTAAVVLLKDFLTGIIAGVLLHVALQLWGGAASLPTPAQELAAETVEVAAEEGRLRRPLLQAADVVSSDSMAGLCEEKREKEDTHLIRDSYDDLYRGALPRTGAPLPMEEPTSGSSMS